MKFGEILLPVLGLCLIARPVGAQTNVSLRFMAANISSGTQQAYEAPGIRIFQGLKPDVVAIQEFNYAGKTPAEMRTFVDTAFGTNFSYYRESASFQIPNGIISRWPIIQSGSWDDAEQSPANRGFAWAQIDLPGTNDLYVVSVHLLTRDAPTRSNEAAAIKTNIAAHFPAGAWIVVGGDCNTSSRSEAAITTFKTFLSDNPIPIDLVSGGNPDTNEPRSSPYDYVLPSFSLTNYQVSVVVGANTFPKGLVFDSAIFANNYTLGAVSPVQSGDSHVTGMQHMAVIKDFSIPVAGGLTTNPPAITTQPQSQGMAVGNPAIFSVLADGSAPLSYQWRFNGTNISGATTNPFVLPNVQTTNAGNYSVVITNVAGSVTSSVATLTVLVTNSVVFAQWNFNSVTPDSNTGTGSTAPSIGSGAASLVGGVVPNATGFAGGDTTFDSAAPADNTAWNTTNYPAASVSNKTAGVQFAVSTAGKQSIVISWSQRSSNTGGKYFRLQYSTNSGAGFQDFPAAVTVGTAFSAFTNSLVSIPGVNNNSNFIFRIVAEFESTAAGSGSAAYLAANASASNYGPAGATRFDMVSVSGTAYVIATPATLDTTAFTNGQLAFQVSGSTGASYVVQVSTNLSSTNWLPVFTNLSPFSFSETNLAAPQKFYRAVAQ